MLKQIYKCNIMAIKARLDLLRDNKKKNIDYTIELIYINERLLDISETMNENSEKLDSILESILLRLKR